MEPETTGIIISTAVATKALDVALAWAKAKFIKGNEPHKIEQSSYQAWCNDNAMDHDDIFKRLRNNETQIALLLERSVNQSKTLDRVADQVSSLHDYFFHERGKR